MIIDSDVLIWWLRGQKKAIETIDKLPRFEISTVSCMEVIQGIKNKEELRCWKALLKKMAIDHLMVDEEICSKAIYWLEDYAPSHGLQMPDALIAATAENYGLELLTGNAKDYDFLPGVFVKSFRL